MTWRTFVTGECDRCHVDHGEELLALRGEEWLCRSCRSLPRLTMGHRDRCSCGDIATDEHPGLCVTCYREGVQ